LEIEKNVWDKVKGTGKWQINYLTPAPFVYPGEGCSFKNLHPDSDLSEESKNRLRQYGAKI
jgi:hypothetical protein